MLVRHPAVAAAVADWWPVLAPPPKLTVSAWADANRKLSPEASSEVGDWNTARAEYQRGIMDALSDPTVQRIVCRKSSQVGWTEILNNVCGYFIDQDPSPILVLQPTLEMAEAWSEDRLTPMLRDSPCFHRQFNPKKRDSGNTKLKKKFAGGHLTAAGANSPASLASRPIRVVLADELDRYPVSAGREGDPLNLAVARTKNFWNRKILCGGTPTIAGASRTEEEWEKSDKRFFHVTCPHCGGLQYLKWAQVQWNRDAQGRHLPETAYYLCEHADCGGVLDDGDILRAVARGRWIATAPFTGVAGFHIWEIYSPWVKLSETVTAFLAAKANPETLKTWTNTALGECWVEQGEAPDWQRLYERRSQILMLGDVPEWAGILTIGSDVQRNRIEADVWAWGPGNESALVDHVVIDGDPGGELIWAEMDQLLTREWETPSGRRLRPLRLAIDTGDGYSTTQVYAWARRHPRTVMPVKGIARFDSSAPVSGPTRVDATQSGRKIRGGVQLWTVAVSVFKSETYAWLNLAAPLDGQPYPAGYIHLPQGTTDTWIRQLVAEQLVRVKNRLGFVRMQWENPSGARNEAIDMRVYARAAAYVLGVDRWNERRWAQVRGEPVPTRPVPSDDAGAPQASAAPVSGAAEATPSPAAPQRRVNPVTGRQRGSFWDKR